MYLLLFASASFPLLVNVTEVTLVEVILFSVDSHPLNGVKGFWTKSALMNKDTAVLLADVTLVAWPRIEFRLKRQRHF